MSSQISRDRSRSPRNKRNPIEDSRLLLRPPPGVYSDPQSIHQEDGTPILTFIKQTEEKQAYGLRSDYMRIKTEFAVASKQLGGSPQNSKKNRYNDIQCLDQTRVVLRDGKAGDYIHANFVDGYKQSRAYICTQGPLRNTIIDFWRMIWQERCVVVVMVTRIEEGQKVKCEYYWPEEFKKTVRYGPFIVQCIRKEDHKVADEVLYTETILSVKRTGTDETRRLHHCAYQNWPDHEVPKNPIDFYHFVNQIRHLQHSLISEMKPTWTGHPNGPPLVVHCSAGIGRAGSYIAIDICSRSIFDCQKINVEQTVRKIRSQRLHAVQTVEQYLFLHLAIIQIAIDAELVHVDTIDLTGFVMF